MRHRVTISSRAVETEIMGAGDKTLVILPGMACPLDDWIDIMKQLSANWQVVSFHRAGCGFSDANPIGPSVANTAADLDSILRALEIGHEIVLVGHSYGGLCAQRFAREYPNRVCGVVLVDSTPVELRQLNELELPTLDAQQSDAAWIEECQRLAQASAAEITEYLVHFDGSLLSPHQLKLGVEIQSRIITFLTRPSLYATMAKETRSWEDCAAQIQQLGPFPDVPLKVLARDPAYAASLLRQDGIPEGEAALFEQAWHQFIAAQSLLNRQGELITAINASHGIHEDRPDLVLKMIASLL